MGKFGKGPLGDTSGYSDHKCNGFYEEDSDVKQNIADIKRYTFYAERFNNHARSCKIEKRDFLAIKSEK